MQLHIGSCHYQNRMSMIARWALDVKYVGHETQMIASTRAASAPFTPQAPAPAAPTRFVSFLHPVNGPSVRALINTVTQIIQREQVKSIGLLISTPGGDVNEGVLLFNALRTLPVSITTYNVGNVDSIGNVVFLAGDQRVASPSSTFMFHGVGWTVGAPTTLDTKAVREISHQLDVLTTRIKSIIASCTTVPGVELDDLFLNASTKDANYAKLKGIAHDIGDPLIPNPKALTHSPFGA